jgi:hypothetical protein
MHGSPLYEREENVFILSSRRRNVTEYQSEDNTLEGVGR